MPHLLSPWRRMGSILLGSLALGDSWIFAGCSSRTTGVVIAALVLIGQLTAPQERAVAELRRLGADVRVETISPDPTEIWVDFHSKATSDACLAPIQGLAPLTALRILNGEVTDRGLGQIRDVPRLWLLVVRSPKITDTGVETLSKIVGLRKLDLIDVKVTRNGLRHLAKLKKLERLFLYGTSLRDDDLKPLERLTWLRQLSLPNTISTEKTEALKRALPRTQIDRH